MRKTLHREGRYKGDDVVVRQGLSHDHQDLRWHVQEKSHHYWGEIICYIQQVLHLCYIHATLMLQAFMYTYATS